MKKYFPVVKEYMESSLGELAIHMIQEFEEVMDEVEINNISALMSEVLDMAQLAVTTSNKYNCGISCKDKVEKKYLKDLENAKEKFVALACGDIHEKHLPHICQEVFDVALGCFERIRVNGNYSLYAGLERHRDKILERVLDNGLTLVEEI